MISHEYDVKFVFENCVIVTLAHLPDEDLEEHEEWAIGQAEDRLAYDGIDLSKMDCLEISVTKTGEYR